MKTLITLFFSVILCSGATNLNAQSVYPSVPENIDTNKNYLFFMHGKIVEKKGLPASSKKYGDYEYQDMLDTFTSSGFIVISEARSSGTDIIDYAYSVKGQIEKLLKAGVSPSKITVSGFSKGGRITLLVSSILANKDIHYVVLAGCRDSDIEPYDLKPSGKILSIYDSSDDKFESCSGIFAEKNKDAITNEIVLEIGDGHAVFYQPMDEWVSPMVKWSNK